MKFTFWNFPGEKTFFPTKPLSWREIPNCKFFESSKDSVQTQGEMKFTFWNFLFPGKKEVILRLFSPGKKDSKM